jgi:hypothetical protein
MMRSNGGWDAFTCMIIKEFPCNNKTELLIEEEKNRKEYQATLNKIRAYRTEEEAKEHVKQYYEANRDKIKEHVKQYSKQYYEENRDKILEQTKQYHEANKEYYRDYYKDYHQANKLKKLITQKEEPILTGSPSETETEDEEAGEPRIIEVTGNGIKCEIQIY